MPDETRLRCLKGYLTRLQPAGKYMRRGYDDQPEWVTTSWHVRRGPGFSKEIIFRNSHAAFAYCEWNDTYIRALIKELENA